jgi:phosphate transport system permease protein
MSRRSVPSQDPASAPAPDAIERRLRRRHRAEIRFQIYGIAAISVALLALAALLIGIVSNGLPAFFQHVAELEVTLDAELVDPDGNQTPESLRTGSYASVLRNALQARFPEAETRQERRALGDILSDGAAYALQDRVVADRELVGETIDIEALLSDDADLYFKGRISAETPESDRRLSDAQIGWLDTLDRDGRVHASISTEFFTTGDSAEPELAGIRAALVGSLLTLLVTFLLSFPVGVATAVYLEEFAPKNRFTDVIEVNINNLAAVPSIVFGLLGLAVILNLFGLPRSAPLVGGIVLALMTLPTIIIAARAALRAVPPSIREGALGVGASPMQVVAHHVLPLAMPGILTGTIIGMAQALGETAPLLMIGMVAFVVSVPTSVTDASTVLPVQIFLWANNSERAFVDKTSAAILVLLAFLMTMTLGAVLLRRRFERRW